jgi:hypothetical protein
MLPLGRKVLSTPASAIASEGMTNNQTSKTEAAVARAVVSALSGQKKKKKSKKSSVNKGAPGAGGAKVNGGMAFGKAPRNVGVKDTSGRIASQGLPATKRAHIMHACSLTNPFCSGARGFRLPDGKGFNTIGQQLRGRVSMNGGFNTSGSVYGNILVFQPTAPYGVWSPASFSAGSYTMGTSMTEYLGNTIFASGCSGYRLVSMGCIVRVVSAVTNTSGIVTLSTAAPNSWTGSVLAASSPDWIEQYNEPCATGAEYTWISKPYGSESSQFLPLSGSTTTGLTNVSWTALVVELSAAAAATTLDVEYFVNVEAQLDVGSSLTHMAPPPTPPNPVAIKLRDTVHQKTPSGHAGGPDFFDEFMLNVLKPAANVVMQNVSLDSLMSMLAFL